MHPIVYLAQERAAGRIGAYDPADPSTYPTRSWGEMSDEQKRTVVVAGVLIVIFLGLGALFWTGTGYLLIKGYKSLTE